MYLNPVFILSKIHLKNIQKQLSTIWGLCLSGILSIGLVAFFTFPVLTETKYVSIDSMFNGYYYFSAHFVSLFQMFMSNFWGDGGSIWGPNDSMSFMIGYLHWAIPLFITIMFFVNFSQFDLDFMSFAIV